MRRLIPALFLLVLITSCARNKIPADVLPREKMQALVWDLLRSAEFVDAYILNRDSAYDKGTVGAQIYNEVFRMHKVSRATFDKSLVYYQEHPDLFRQIMDSLEKKQYIDPATKAVDSTAIKDTQPKPPVPSPNIILDSIKKGKRPLLR